MAGAAGEKPRLTFAVTPVPAYHYRRRRLVALQLISTLKRELGDLDRVKRVVKLVGFVNCADGFTEQPQVINGASDLIGEVFG